MNPSFFVSDQLTKRFAVFVVLNLYDVKYFYKILHKIYEIYEILTKSLTIKDFKIRNIRFIFENKRNLQSPKKRNAEVFNSAINGNTI